MSDLKASLFDPQVPPLERLCSLMEILRAPGGCNWDRAQTHQSLMPYLIEETYEVLEAIQAGQPSELCEELGDLLCQIVFHAQVAKEAGNFDINDVAQSITDKLIRRHPHVFGEKRDLNPTEVRDQWEKIKTASGEKKSVLAGLPRTAPALTTAFRTGEKAGGVGFDWPGPGPALEKVEEEIAEVRQALAEGQAVDRDHLAEEFGDLLFATASAARLAGVDPEAALRRSLKKFRGRFESLESEVKAGRGAFDDYDLAELEQIWQRIKISPNSSST